MRRFLYFYIMRNAPDAILRTVPAHVEHWHGLKLPDYLGGPFMDRTGGLITFAAPSLATAQQAIGGDPFVREGLIEQSWVKEWLVD